MFIVIPEFEAISHWSLIFASSVEYLYHVIVGVESHDTSGTEPWNCE